MRWTFIKKLVGGHRLFKDAEKPGEVAIADQSGEYPDQTDDGILYLDTLRSIEHHEFDGRESYSLPIKDALGRRYGTPVSLAAAICISDAYGLGIDVPDLGLVKVKLESAPFK